MLQNLLFVFFFFSSHHEIHCLYIATEVVLTPSSCNVAGTVCIFALIVSLYNSALQQMSCLSAVGVILTLIGPVHQPHSEAGKGCAGQIPCPALHHRNI